MHCNRKILAFLIHGGVLASALPIQAQTQRQAPTGAVVRVPWGTAAPVLVPTSACPRSAFPRGPPLPA